MNRSRDKLCAFCEPFVNKCVREARVSFEHETGCFSYLETSARDGCPLCGVIVACIVDETLTPLHLQRKDLSPIKLTVSRFSLDIICVNSASGTELGVVSGKTLRAPPESFLEDDKLGDPYLLEEVLEDKITSPFRISTNFRAIDKVFDERKYKGRREMHCVQRNGADMSQKICDLTTEAGQQEMAGLVTEWLETCCTHHAQCAGPADQHLDHLDVPPLPTRVLDVGTLECPYLRLHVSEDGERKEYTCLSYCWGTGVPQFGTTKATMDNLQRQIPFPELPKTIQDAIVFTRRLRIRYLWVDALCIIQDDTSDPSDWRLETARFGTYYQNALCTLSATGSYDSSEGLFLPSWDRIYPTYFCMRLNRDPKEPLYYTWFPTVHDPWSLISKAPLSNRGWPGQERLLSPRIVHFTRRYVVWECFEHIASERDPERDVAAGFEDDGILPGFSTRRLPYSEGDQHPMCNWSSLCEWYMRQKFSRRSDRLPALSGVVQRLQDHTKNQFYAGLWEGSLVPGLDWLVIDPESIPSTQVLCAPSWSWIHVTGQLLLPELMPWESIFSTEEDNSPTTSATEPRITSIKIQETGHGISGSTTSGTIAMYGILSTLNFGELGYKQDPRRARNRWETDGGLEMGSMHWDRLPLEVDPHGTHVCLQLREHNPWGRKGDQGLICALVLVLVSDDADGIPEYRRVGRGTFSRDVWDGGRPEWRDIKLM